MKTLIQKELRENLKLALPGLLIFSGLLAYSYHLSQGKAEQFLGGYSPGEDVNVQPLLSSALLTMAGYFCAVFGGALGWLQIFSERHPDMRAFLVHRPLSGNRIFATKVIAGISLYTLAVGFPMLVFILMVRQPGRVAAPFEWAMALPVGAIFLIGLVWYFAGMLTGLRQARWYATRLSGLVLAWVIHLLIFGKGFGCELRLAGMFLLVGGGLLAWAAWGNFQSGGQDKGRPKSATVALGAVIALACTVVGLLLAIPLMNALSRSSSLDRIDSISYSMGKDGVLYRVTKGADGNQLITDLAGAPAKNPKTGRLLEVSAFSEFESAEVPINDGNRGRGSSWKDAGRFFCRWRIENGVLWYWTRDGKLLGFDGRTHRPVGDIKASSEAIESAGFLPPSGFSFWYDNMPGKPPRTLAARSGVYAIDLEHQTARALLTVEADDQIVWSSDITGETTAVVSKHHLFLLGEAGNVLWEIPYEAEKQVDTRLYPLDFVPGQYALWTSRLDATNKAYSYFIPQQVTWIAQGQGIVKKVDLKVDLPANNTLSKANSDHYLINNFLASLASSFLIQLAKIPQHQPVPGWVQTRSLIGTLIYGVLSGWLVGRRYRLKTGEQLGWVVFNLAFGLPGFLAFLAVHDWPAREMCPKCQKLRLVDRKKCEHCEAEFPPSPRLGIEIFEPIGEVGIEAGMKNESLRI